MTNTKIRLEERKRSAELRELYKALENMTPDDDLIRHKLEIRIRNQERRLLQLSEIQDWEERRWELVKIFSSALMQGEGEITPAEIANLAVSSADAVIAKMKGGSK